MLLIPQDSTRKVEINCNSHKVCEKLIQKGFKLTLEKAIDIARTPLLSHQQLQTMAGKDPKVHSLKVKYSKKEKHRKCCNNEPQHTHGDLH